ncbi:MAG TPA: PTS IIA-like nitrogen regulatory protein PtsN [Xanthomonadales bacterium]|nr:PTS IIA-like nitrogen regulatory protein PtsN [Xanthomonadales bacterium]
MLISDLLNPESIRFDVHTSSKKRLLEIISEHLARNSDDLSAREIFESLCARERLGSTGLGKGVAIPHGRVRGNRAIQASFIRLKKPLPFDSADGEPVDLLFAMTVPENCSEEHLKLLAQVAELFSDPQVLKALREADDPATLLRLLSTTRTNGVSGTQH